MALDMSKISVASFLKKANKGASARRCLFGPVNHEENTRFLREQLAIQERESKSKWNFDFRTETPISGKFQWEKVEVADENQVPVAYSLPQLVKPTPTKARVCQPLSFSRRVNLNSLNTTSKNSQKQDVIIVKKDNVDLASPSIISPAAERKSVTTVPQVNVIRDETPGLFYPVNILQSSTSSSSSSQEENKSTSSSQSENSSSVSTSHITRVSLKRKNSQTDITEFFQIKKSRNMLAAASAKRKLDL